MTAVRMPTGLSLIADATRVSDAALDLFADRCATLFAAIADGTAADTPLDELPILGDAEKQLVTQTWNDTTTDYAASTTMHGHIAAQAARTPDATALIFEHETLSHAALQARANRIAHTLRDMGVAPGQPVADGGLLELRERARSVEQGPGTPQPKKEKTENPWEGARVVRCFFQ